MECSRISSAATAQNIGLRFGVPGCNPGSGVLFEGLNGLVYASASMSRSRVKCSYRIAAQSVSRTSRTLSMNCGPVDSLNHSERCGCPAPKELAPGEPS